MNNAAPALRCTFLLTVGTCMPSCTASLLPISTHWLPADSLSILFALPLLHLPLLLLLSGIMLAAEPAEPTVMDRPPRRPGKRLLVRAHYDYCCMRSTWLHIKTSLAAPLSVAKMQLQCWPLCSLTGHPLSHRLLTELCRTWTLHMPSPSAANRSHNLTPRLSSLLSNRRASSSCGAASL